MENKQVSEVIDEIGTLLELTGENPFRSRAYHNAARIIEGLTDNLQSLAQSESLTSVKGIGQGIAATITELLNTGKAQLHEELRAKIPSGVLEMLRIQGLGPKRIKILYEKLHISSIAELRDACHQQNLRSIDGFGEKTEENILKSLDHLERSSDKHLFPQAFESAEKIVAMLTQIKGVKDCTYAGSLRRRKEIIGDIDILLSAAEKSREAIMAAFTKQEDAESVIAQGETKSAVILKNGIQCDLRVVSESEYPFALNYFTGSKEHNVELRSLARKRGLSLNEYGFSRIAESKSASSKKKNPVCATEEDIYRHLGLDYIPPELRENTDEIDAAQKHKIPKLIEWTDIRGTFHCHSTDSDGLNTIDQMVEAAQRLGWQYIGFADHSQAAAYAGGMSPAKARDQMKRIDRMNGRFNSFRVFKGVECDILTDGSLDYNDSLLAEFDYVVASIHSKFKMTESESTKRIIKALKNKNVTMLGHPTGRLLLQREGYPVNIPEIITAAADYGKAIEINAHPMRLDLDWRYLKLAKEKGVLIFINPDAHKIDGLQDVRFGVGIARKGWLEPNQVVNCWTVLKVVNYLKRKK
ncbi:MAG: DNA polymerase/3'-5' exonuclease PolX [Ignavibacteriae bacterium]|nr:MAG: DNA polymerase/3'-5' exonuclease PolX [Ignavibacteriota bacterium]